MYEIVWNIGKKNSGKCILKLFIGECAQEDCDYEREMQSRFNPALILENEFEIIELVEKNSKVCKEELKNPYLMIRYDTDLFREIFKHGRMNLNICHWLGKEIFSQIKEIHAAGVLLDEINIENILIDSKSGKLNVCGGFSRRTTKTLKDNLFDFGKIVFIIHIGTLPFQEACERDWWYHKLMFNQNLFWKAFTLQRHEIDDEFKAFIIALMGSDARQTIEEVEKLSWWKRVSKFSNEAFISELANRKKFK